MHLRPMLLLAGLLSGHVTVVSPSDPISRRHARVPQVAEVGRWSRKHGGMHRHGVSGAARGEGGTGQPEMERSVADPGAGVKYNPYSKHHPGRHVCTTHSERPMKSKQAYCKPTFRNYVIRCQGNQVCKGVKLVYETHYKDIITQSKNDVVYACCPGWTQISNRNHGCNKPSCSKPCLNGGKCVIPELCACLKGFSGQQCEINVDIPLCQKPCLNEGKCVRGICSCPKGFGGVQCEIDLNKPLCSSGCENGGTCARHEVCRCLPGFAGRRCEIDVDECSEQKPCDHICHDRPGGFECQCKEDFVLQSDGQSCRKEGDEGGLEAKDLEFEILDKRLLKLETMMDESHKNDVSKGDLENVYKDMSSISRDIGTIKNKLNDVESYKNDLHIFKNKLTTIEKKAEKVDELVLKYDRMKKCAFYNKICI